MTESDLSYEFDYVANDWYMLLTNPYVTSYFQESVLETGNFEEVMKTFNQSYIHTISYIKPKSYISENFQLKTGPFEAFIRVFCAAMKLEVPEISEFERVTG